MRLKSTLVIIAATLLVVSQSAPAQTNAASGGGTNAAGRRGNANMTVDQRLARLNEQLTLNDQQKAKVKVVLEEQNKQMAGMRDLPQEERRTKNAAIREEYAKKMKEILTADQFKKFEALQTQVGQRGQRNRGGQGGGAPGANAPSAPSGEKPPQK